MSDEPYPIDGGEVAVGDTGPEIVSEDLGIREFVKYAGASGDFNRMHYDREYARGKGSPDVFAQGMLVAGYAGSMLSAWFGVDTVDTFSTRFESRVWVGDTVTTSGEITEVTQSGSKRMVEVSIAVCNQNGETVVTGTAMATLPSES